MSADEFYPRIPPGRHSLVVKSQISGAPFKRGNPATVFPRIVNDAGELEAAVEVEVKPARSEIFAGVVKDALELLHDGHRSREQVDFVKAHVLFGTRMELTRRTSHLELDPIAIRLLELPEADDCRANLLDRLFVLRQRDGDAWAMVEKLLSPGGT